MAKAPAYDEIGYWSEIKLDIVRKYAAAYSTIISRQTKARFHHIYIDAFAGAGLHISRTTKGYVKGSPLNALEVDPPFSEYHFIDLRPQKTESLRKIVGDRKNVYIYQGDCNEILLAKIFERVRYEDFRRGLCFLDPYGLDLKWEVTQTAGEMKSLEIFLNFPIMDINRNVLRRDPGKVDRREVERLNAYWGDESWREAAYDSLPLFDEIQEKASNEAIAQALRKRLIEEARFKYVPNPIPMRNRQNSIVYYLFFATQNRTGKNIVEQIFEKYGHRRSV